MTDVHRLFVLLCGFEILPKTVSTRDRGEAFILSEPVCAYLLDTAQGWVLLDAGLDPGLANDPVRREAVFLSQGMTPPVVRAAHRLAPQLARIGIGWDDIGHVILSHLHYDHAGHLPELTHARVSVQRREHAAAFGAGGPGYLPDDLRAAKSHWDLRDGDWRAMPGLELIDTRGHTAGHQSAIVTLPRTGTIVLPFDAGDLAENYDEEVLPGESCDDAAALAAIRRINAIVTEREALMLLFHDPVAIQRMRLAPDCYD